MVPGTAGEGVVVTVNEDGKTFAASASEGLGSTPTGQPGRGRAAGSRDVAAVLCVAPPSATALAKVIRYLCVLGVVLMNSSRKSLEQA